MSRRTLVAFFAVITLLASSVASAQTLSIKTDVTTLRTAADAGNADAMFLMGLKYHGGQTKPYNPTQVPQDYVQASVWYRKASDFGHGTSMFYLGTFYWSGRGVAKDVVEAYKWLELSARYRPTQDDRVRSGQACESLARVMSAAQIQEAKQRAAAWQAAFIGKK